METVSVIAIATFIAGFLAGLKIAKYLSIKNCPNCGHSFNKDWD